MSGNRIFISWSKHKSKKLAEETKIFLEKCLGNTVEFFFSPEMYKGTCVDNQIHENLLSSSKCIVCITSENFKNPWLLYEAGVIYGANHLSESKAIVIPVLFEDIPDWSSWIDKPLNRYVPLQMQNSNKEFSAGKKDFHSLLKQLGEEFNIKVKRFNGNWIIYEEKIKKILIEEQLIPSECMELVNKLLANNNSTFSIVNPEITKDHILFHKGFTTFDFMKILTNSIINDQGKYLWFYGRKNKKLLSRENDDFFSYLSKEGLKNGVDFRCMFPYPGTLASVKSSSKDRLDMFENEIMFSLKQAYSLKNKFGLPVEKMFRLYKEPRNESIIRSDNSVIHRQITRDSEGYPIPYTNSNFEIISALSNNNHNNKGVELINKFSSIWNDETKSVPLTQEILNELYAGK